MKKGMKYANVGSHYLIASFLRNHSIQLHVSGEMNIRNLHYQTIFLNYKSKQEHEINVMSQINQYIRCWIYFLAIQAVLQTEIDYIFSYTAAKS